MSWPEFSAHEIGHISTHQIAIVFTRAFRVRLGVTQVTDRADIFARVHQYFTTRPKMDELDDTDDKHEIVADRVALYAMVRAGYAPKTYANFFDQVSMNKGKTGSWLSDMLGKTRQRAALPLGAEADRRASGRMQAEAAGGE